MLDWIGYQLMLRGPWRVTCNPYTRFGAWCLRRAGSYVHRETMTDILTELRTRENWNNGGLLYKEAADEIEQLRAALEFYADPARWMKVNGVDDEQVPDFYDECNFGERALLALNQRRPAED